MIHDDGVAVDPQIVGKDDDPIVGALHRSLSQRGQIESQVSLFVHHLPPVEVGAEVGKGRFDWELLNWRNSSVQRGVAALWAAISAICRLLTRRNDPLTRETSPVNRRLP